MYTSALKYIYVLVSSYLDFLVQIGSLTRFCLLRSNCISPHLSKNWSYGEAQIYKAGTRQASGEEDRHRVHLPILQFRAEERDMPLGSQEPAWNSKMWYLLGGIQYRNQHSERRDRCVQRLDWCMRARKWWTSTDRRSTNTYQEEEKCTQQSQSLSDDAINESCTWAGKLKYVSVERRAESREWTAEIFRFVG